MKRSDRPRELQAPATAPVTDATQRKEHGMPGADAVAYAVAALVAAYAQAPDKAKLLPRLIAASTRIASVTGPDRDTEQLARLTPLQHEAARLAAEHLERKQHLAAAAAALAQSTDWKETRTALDRLMHEWRVTGWSDEALTAAPRTAFNTAIATFTRRQEQWFDEQRMRGAPVNEYRDYLCTRAEQLLDETDDTMWAASSERLKQLQQLWKKTTRFADDPDLSARFVAAERAFQDRRDAWYADNLERKRELLHRIATLGDTTTGLAWEAARREVADIEKHDWHEAGQVPHDQHEAMERDLRRALATFRVRQEEAEVQALKQKEKIITRIQALSQHPLENWKATRAVLLELQEAYAGVGPVAEAGEADLLRSYRAACQAVAARLGTLRGNSTEKRQGVLRQIRDLTARAGKDVTWRDARDKVLVLQKQYMNAGPIARVEGEALWQEYRAACDRFFELYRSWTGDNVDVKEELCAEAEALLEDRDPFEAKEKAKKLQGRWKYAGPVPPEQNEALWSRFSAALDKVFDRARIEWEDLHNP